MELEHEIEVVLWQFQKGYIDIRSENIETEGELKRYMLFSANPEVITAEIIRSIHLTLSEESLEKYSRFNNKEKVKPPPSPPQPKRPTPPPTELREEGEIRRRPRSHKKSNKKSNKKK